MATNERIFLQKPPMYAVHDGVSDEAISPGEAVEVGGANDIQKQSTGGENAEVALAMVDRSQHKDRSDDWASGDTVEYAILQPGATAYVRLPTGGSEVNISKGEFLEFNGDGTFVSEGTGSAPNHRAVVALEAVDNSSGASEAFIKVRRV